MKNTVVNYEGCKTIATITGKDGNGEVIVAVGVAYWNPEDVYDKQRGKQIAIGRARKQLAQLEASAVTQNVMVGKEPQDMATNVLSTLDTLAEGLAWLVENEPHRGHEGDEPHDDCVPCFARQTLNRASFSA